MSIINTKKIEFGGKTLLLRLDAKTIVNVEKRLGKSLLALFITNGGMNFPTVGELLLVLQSANTKHSVKESDMYELYDNYIASGKTFMDLNEFASDLLSDAGFLPKNEKKEAEKIETAGESLVQEAEIIEMNPDSELV